MKRIPLSLALLCAVALLAFGLTSCQPASEPPANTAPPVVRETPLDVAGITAELTRIENDFPRVVKEHDAENVRTVVAEDYFGILPDGSLTNRAQDIKDMQEGNLTAETWEVTDLKVQVLDNDAAVVSGRSIVKGGKARKNPEGKWMDISGEYRFIDTFARRSGTWKLVASVTVRVANPGPTASPTPKASPAVVEEKVPAKATPAATKAVPPPPSPKTTP